MMDNLVDKQLFEGLSNPDYTTLELALRRLDELLILRTFIRGYSCRDLDKELWLAIRHNKVALRVMRRPSNFTNVMRWYYYITDTQPHLGDSHNIDWVASGKPNKDRYKMKLQDADKGVVTRFPPEPSGYLHIGHAKAAFLNDYFAQDASSGSLILRFDDTNPLKEKQEYEDSIKEDLDLLGIKVQRTTYTSDYFEQLYDLAKQLISRGKAYADGTDIDNQALDRRNRLPSACRDRPAEESLAIFDEMRRGTDWGKKHCIRARIQYDNSNGSLRDPIIYRFPSWDAQKGPQPHHRTGLAWNIYPTYDFACPLVDSFEGVTHALRTTEYADRNAQYYWFLEALDLRRVHLWDFARINFIRTFLSKRKLARVVESGLVDGWDDPRLPTIRGIVRRGLSVDVLREFMLKQGPSRNVVSMDWTVLWAMNRKAIDPIASRYAAVEAPSTVLVTIEGVEKTWCEPRPMHPKNGDLGTKMMTFSNKIWIEQVDAASLLESEEVTLMHWGNAVVQDIVRNDGIVASMKMTLNLDGDASRTKKLHWVASKNLMHAELWEFGHLLTKDSLQKQDVLDDFLNPVTSSMVMAKIDRQFAAVKPGNFVQLERKGYYRVDGFTGQEALRTTVLFKIPNGARS